LSFADLSPALRPTEWGPQVMTPLTGEPLFAQLWYGEALNFGKISDWNAQLDLARRLRVSSLSIHADAFLHARGAELLDQLVKQQREENLLGVWLHEYVQRVRAFQTASIARDLDGAWLLFGDALRTVRLPVSEKAPAISGDVIGYFDLHASRYIFLARNHAVLKSAAATSGNDGGKDGKTPALRLTGASAPLKSWHLNSDGSATLLFEPRGVLTVEVPPSCRLSLDGRALTNQSKSSRAVFTVPENGASGEFRLEC
jgi:hypothetical protein